MTEQAATERSRRERPDLRRLIAAAIVIAAFIALAGLAIAASRSSLSFGLPAAAHDTTPPSVDAPAARPDVSNLASFTNPVPGAAPASAAPGAPAVAAPPAATVARSVPPASAPASGTTSAACPQLALPPPTDVGGLQSLIELVPLFGPFSPEAFALLPAFEAGFPALGPLFPVFQQGLDQAAPLLSAATPIVQQLVSSGFAALGPLYAPQRPSVLAAEKQLAAQLAPTLQKLATAPGSECLVALEGVLAAVAKA